jgi:Zn ribbon nucleic-acid-binding protein
VSPTLTTSSSVAPPSGADRCDRCGAQGKIRVVLAAGGDLVFCGHHAREYDETIRAVAAEVVPSEEPSIN